MYKISPLLLLAALLSLINLGGVGWAYYNRQASNISVFPEKPDMFANPPAQSLPIPEAKPEVQQPQIVSPQPRYQQPAQPYIIQPQPRSRGCRPFSGNRQGGCQPYSGCQPGSGCGPQQELVPGGSLQPSQAEPYIIQ